MPRIQDKILITIVLVMAILSFTGLPLLERFL
jgi:hypothetical protein